MTISFHELTRHHGFKELREIAVYRLGGDEPEKLGTIHCSDRQFEGQYLARLNIEELEEIKRNMLEVKPS